jgi:hypothetical protein
MTGGQSKILEFPDETELHNTGRDELQRFRKPLPRLTFNFKWRYESSALVCFLTLLLIIVEGRPRRRGC